MCCVLYTIYCGTPYVLSCVLFCLEFVWFWLGCRDERERQGKDGTKKTKDRKKGSLEERKTDERKEEIKKGRTTERKNARKTER